MELEKIEEKWKQVSISKRNLVIWSVSILIFYLTTVRYLLVCWYQGSLEYFDNDGVKTIWTFMSLVILLIITLALFIAICGEDYPNITLEKIDDKFCRKNVNVFTKEKYKDKLWIILLIVISVLPSLLISSYLLYKLTLCLI